MLRPILDFIIKKKLICVKLCVELGKTAPEANEILRTSFGNITMGRTWIFSGFLDSNAEKTAKDRERGGRSSIVSGDEKLQTVSKIVKDERPFRRSPSCLASRTEHVRRFKGRPYTC
jgi:hypothetical protein